MIVASNNITLSNVNDGSTPYVHIAYANSADGTDGFYVSGGRNYIQNSESIIMTPNGTDNYDLSWYVYNDDFASNAYCHGNNKTRFSFYLTPSKALSTARTFRIYWRASPWTSFGTITVPANTTDTQYYELTITTPTSQPIASQIFIRFMAQDTSDISYTITKSMLTIGDSFPDWCPAPSEMNPTYMGTYTDYTQEASSDPSSYQWSLIKGNDGKDGLGIRSTIITYQLSSSGTTTPTGTWSTTVPTLVKGQYLWTRTTLVYTDNTTKDIDSVSYVAKDGNNGTDGVAGKDGVGVKSTTITYQSGTSGTVQPTGTWVDNPPSVTGGNYLWTRTVWNYTDGTSETGYSVAKAGEKGDKGADGPQGIPGKPGADGKTSYTHIAYADTATGGGFSPSSDNKKYIGIYTDFTADDSNDATKYTWSLIKGADGKEGPQGIPGPAGADGKTSYLHVAYAQNPKDPNGNTGFTTSPDINSSYKYIGTYTDYTSTSSTDPSSYKWVAMFDSTKKRNFTTTPTTPYAVGDTWIDRGSATYFCTKSRDSGPFYDKDWKMQQLTIQSLDNNIQTDLNNSVKTTGNYKGVTLNDNGLTATAGSTKVAMNSNDGFLINNAGGQVFHVDTNGNLTMQGDITAGNISGVEFTGKDLTLNNSLNVINGQILFANGNGVLSSNGISIKGGGLSITSPVTNKQTTYIRPDGTLFASDGDFSGKVTTNQLILTGSSSSINMNGNFVVDNQGNVTAKSLALTGNGEANTSNSASLKGVSIYGSSVIEGANFFGDNLTLSGNLAITGDSGAISSNFSYTDEYKINNVGETVISNGGLKSVSNRTLPSDADNEDDFLHVVSYEFSPIGYRSFGYKNKDEYTNNNPGGMVAYNYSGVHLNLGTEFKSEYTLGGFSGNSINGDNTFSKTAVVTFGNMLQYASSEAQHSGAADYKDWFDIISGIQSHPNLLHNSSFVNGNNNWDIEPGGYVSNDVHDGNFVLWMSSSGGESFCSQTLTHFPWAGNQICLSYWANIVNNDGGVNAGVLIVFQGANLNYTATIQDAGKGLSTGWKFYSFNPITVPNGTTGIQFCFFNNEHKGNRVYFAQPMLNVGSYLAPYMPTY